jgi:UDP-N-acetylmuramoyl-L-alanyl-D-glutamate--2,6-diaminopimelate ligase
MKLLKDILYGTRLVEVVGSTHIAIESIAFDSREVRPFGLFVAVPGTRVDGLQFVEAAQEAGRWPSWRRRCPRRSCAGRT